MTSRGSASAALGNSFASEVLLFAEGHGAKPSPALRAVAASEGVWALPCQLVCGSGASN